jgi:hypothetical protein
MGKLISSGKVSEETAGKKEGKIWKGTEERRSRRES